MAGAALLDTSVLIDLDVRQLTGVAQTFVISTINLAELAAGLDGRDPFINAARREHFAWVERSFEAVGFSADAAKNYGSLCAALRAVGRNPRPRRMDLLIAAVAVSEALPLVTRNAADFQGLHKVLTVVDLGPHGSSA